MYIERDRRMCVHVDLFIVRRYVCTHSCTYMHTNMFADMYNVRVYVCTHSCTYLYVHECVHTHTHILYISIYMSIYMYVHECVINLQVINMTCRQVINLLDRHDTNYRLSRANV